MIASSYIPGIPRLLMDGIQQYVQRYPHFSVGPVSVLYIDIAEFGRFERCHGPVACNDVQDIASSLLLERISKQLFAWGNPEVLRIVDDGVAIVLPHYDVKTPDAGKVVHAFVMGVEESLNQRMRTTGYGSLHLRYGLSTLATTESDEHAAERLYHLIIMARRIAQRENQTVPPFLVESLGSIIQSRSISSYYQPIMQLQTKQPIGWESLARGPKGSELEMPINLFGYAEQLGCLLDLERVCRIQAIRQARLESDERLFINLSPNILGDPDFRQGETRKIIEEVGLRPERIVFEITEHHAIHDYPAFLQLVGHYRDQGYKIAIDDVGAGHSGLVTLMQVKPDFVKVDMQLIRGIDRDPIRQDIVRAIQQISEGFAATVIAEGIETMEELTAIKTCGIQFGQGYLLGMPKPFDGS